MDALLPTGSLGVVVNVTPDDAHLAVAAELEAAGYDAVWVNGGQVDRLDRLDDLVAATTRAWVAPAIVPLGVHETTAIAALQQRLGPSGRFVLGLGGPQLARPMAALAGHLDDLDRLGVGPERRLLAALGPRKTDLARERAAGAITLLTTPASTARSRARLGPDRLLVVHQVVALTDDADQARTAARQPLGFLKDVGGYRAEWERSGFDAGSVDRLDAALVDALVAHGDVPAVADRVAEHRAAGADHVVLSLLPVVGTDRLDVARRLASACTAEV